MPKQAKSSAAKVIGTYANNIQMSLGQVQLVIYDAICDVLFKCDENFVESHRKSKLYQAKLAATSSSQGIVAKSSTNLCYCRAIILNAKKTTEKRQKF